VSGFGNWSRLTIIPMSVVSVVLASLAIVATSTTAVLVGERRRHRAAALRAVVEAMSDVGLVFSDGGRVLAASASLRRLHADDPVGLDVAAALRVEAGSVGAQRIDSVMSAARDGRRETAELPAVAGDGSMRVLEVEGFPVDIANVGGAVTLVDATERRALAMRSAQSERMEALGALAGGLAHDFNNLLFVTLGNLQLLAANDVVSGDEKLSKFVDRSISAVERGAEITKSLLAVARSQPLEETAIVAGDLVRGILPLLRQAMGATRMVELRVPDEPVHLRVDAGRLSSGLLNLAFNSRDAMGPEGTLVVELSRFDDLDRSMLRISVIDDGSGMPPEVAARALEPFFTTKGVGRGTGLGLAAVQAFAEQSGGRVVLRSTVGEGTTVSIELPVHDPTVEPNEPRVHRRAGRRAVVADDEQPLAELVAVWLAEIGVEARWATSPKGALQLVEEFRPDVLVSDANFGEQTDGIELAKLAQAIDPDIAVVFMTGFSASMRALQDLGERTLAKPFSREALHAAVTPLLASGEDGDGR
jgi:signal transduction histidine kinase